VIRLNLVINIPKNKFSIVEAKYKTNFIKPAQNTVFVAKKDNTTISLYKTGKIVLQGTSEEELNKEKQEILDLVFDPKEELILGIDETGRSEITGPFVITALLGQNKDLAIVRDSKKTMNLEKAKERVDSSAFGYITLVLNPRLIDNLRSKGFTLNDIEIHFIVNARNLFEELSVKFKTIVDGMPLDSKNINVEYLPKGDDLVPCVSAASIIAKSTRDSCKNKDKRETWNTKN